MKSLVLWTIYIVIVSLLGLLIFRETEAVPTLRVDEIAPTKFVLTLFKKTTPSVPQNKQTPSSNSSAQ